MARRVGRRSGKRPDPQRHADGRGSYLRLVAGRTPVELFLMLAGFCSPATSPHSAVARHRCRPRACAARPTAARLIALPSRPSRPCPAPRLDSPGSWATAHRPQGRCGSRWPSRGPRERCICLPDPLRFWSLDPSGGARHALARDVSSIPYPTARPEGGRDPHGLLRIVRVGPLPGLRRRSPDRPADRRGRPQLPGGIGSCAR